MVLNIHSIFPNEDTLNFLNQSITHADSIELSEKLSKAITFDTILECIKKYKPTSVTFDDGLSTQFATIIKLSELMDTNVIPKIPMYYFYSTGLIFREDLNLGGLNHRVVHNVEAHSEGLLLNNSRTFLSIKEIKKLAGYSFPGMHGHKHLNLEAPHSDLRKFYTDLVKDARECARNYARTFPDPFMNNRNPSGNLYYCCPYNIQNTYGEIYIETLKKELRELINFNELIIFGGERTDIEDLIR